MDLSRLPQTKHKASPSLCTNIATAYTQSSRAYSSNLSKAVSVTNATNDCPFTVPGLQENFFLVQSQRGLEPVQELDLMSEPNSPTLLPDKIFQFISDPGHKENLSGRVRAACLTCRRKKIKCSGEINCQTCREKGLVCEGLPERKRPRRDGGSVILERIPTGGIDRKRKISHTKKVFLKRPSLSDTKHNTSTGSEDSGYASKLPETTETTLLPTGSASFEASVEDRSMTSNAFEPISTSEEPAKPAMRVDTWQLNPRPPRRHTQFDLRIHPPAEVSPGAQPLSAGLEPSPVNWSAVQDNEPWWTEDAADDGPSLISTARALEEQAHSLRLMANRQANNDHSNEMGDMMRRQTIAFPVSPPGAFDARYDMLQNQHGVFDDMALLLANRTPSSGMTPGLNEFSSWWDINAGDLASMLSPGQVNLHLPISPGQQSSLHMTSMHEHERQTPFDEIATTQAAQNMSQQQTTDGYFGQYWPD